MSASRVGGGARLRGVVIPFRLRPQGVEGPVVVPAPTGGAPSARFYDITPEIPPPQLLIRGSGGVGMAAAAFSGLMDVGPDPRIAIQHREDEELLQLVP